MGSPRDAVASSSVLAAMPSMRCSGGTTVKMPDGLSMEQAAAAMLQGMTAHYWLIRLSAQGRRHRVGACRAGALACC